MEPSEGPTHPAEPHGSTGRRYEEQHPGEPVPTRSAYERHLTRHREANPQGRCG
ncbi:CstA-like transporter-associated (seleno)protein [Streptomyces sp. NPDC088817]|uniref:CstA-like transporter-associated (seleno)protein n=1 Tax=unclassified Streptomyces TaxID=2593676 RepID=UPI0036EAF0BF